MGQIYFRKATIDDIVQISELRKKQLQDEGQKPSVNMDEELHQFFKDKISSGDLIEWIAEDADGAIIATSAIIFMDFPPSFTNPSGKRGYVANMYTSDEYRGQGIAGQLLEYLEKEAKARGVEMLFLHASEMGRKAYVKSGFSETDTFMEKLITESCGNGC